MSKALTVSDYLIQRIREYGVEHVFGVPGDFVLKFYKELEQSTIKIINTTDALAAGYAADAYARMRGLGVVCITYGVGGFYITNAIAQAFSENSPVVIISGVPGEEERRRNLMYHHKVGADSDTQLKVFGYLTAAATRLDNPENAAIEINRVLDIAFTLKQPVYIELPSDMVTATCTNIPPVREKNTQSDVQTLKEAIKETEKIINSAKKPVIIAGVEIHRFALQNYLLKILEKTNIPFTMMLLDKSVISELHPQYLGLYMGAAGNDKVREYVESSDCVILLGAFQSELNLGLWTARIDFGSSIDIHSDKANIFRHVYNNIHIRDFLKELSEANINKRDPVNMINRDPANIEHTKPSTFKNTESPIKMNRVIEALNSFISDNNIVIADPGNSLFVGADMTIHKTGEFIAPAYYLSMGFAIPASIGAGLAVPEKRPVVIVGDGAFLMTGLELATAVRFNLSPIIIVLNNIGYSSERQINDGTYNDVPQIRFSSFPDILLKGKGFDVKTEIELEDALWAARNYADTLCIIDIHLDKSDLAPILERVASILKK